MRATAMQRFREREKLRHQRSAVAASKEARRVKRDNEIEEWNRKRREGRGEAQPAPLPPAKNQVSATELETTPTGRIYIGASRAVLKCIAILDDMKFEDEFHFYTIEKAQDRLRKLLGDTHTKKEGEMLS